MNNFHYIGVLLDMLYGIEMSEEDLEEYGLLGWNLIGNKNVKLYRYSTNIDPIDNSVTLPCNAFFNNEGGCVEAVTIPFEDWERTTNKTINGDYDSFRIENAIEKLKYFTNPYYLSGKMLDYEQVGDKLYFVHNYGKINILYKGILSDSDGLPEITNKEANAIATYIAYILKFKEGLKTNNPLIIQQSEILNRQWLKQCDLARVSYLSQNDLSKILDIKNSWNRPSYNKNGFKPIV